MATCLINYLYFLLLALFISSSFIEFGSIAQLIPQHEVKTLEIISQKLKNPYWNVSQTSCTDGGQSFSKTFASKEVSNVTCDCSYNSSTVCHVTVIQLKGLNLTGYIPEEFGNLVHLQEIDLTRNYISGTIPKSLSKIRLVTLAVSETRITGQIPEEIGQIATLQTLSLEDNQLGGPLPKSLGNLRNLRTLVLASNFFNGTIPETFVNLKNITELRLNGNMLSGKIPDFIGNITSLVTLDIQGTSMEGPIPSTFSLLTNLRTLFLTNNSFSGTLPQWLLNSKDNIDLSYNNFTGSAPSSCQQSNVNLVASYSSAKGNATNWCLLKDLPCSTKPQYHSLFINCGGGKMSFEGNEYEEDTVSDGPSIFFASGQKWAYSSTGTFQFDGDANFLAGTSDPNVTGIYQTARLAPLSLKYYGLCMRRGSYTVKLHFAEIMFTDDQNFSSNGRRIFDVAIQGNEVLKDFNIAEKAGGVGKGITMEFKDVYVNGSTLEIYLYWAGKGTTAVPKRSVYGPLISGITVTPNFKVGSGLSGGAITGIVLASCTILVLFLGILRMTGYLCGKDHENDELRRLDRGYFTLRQIKAATDDFSHRNKIGEGGFGPVYKGVLLDGKVIAVKQLSSKSKQGNREFVTEIGMISALQHPNLVKLYGYCIEGKELLLVYEYMENNCLARALFGREDQKLHLDWRTRKNICSGIARGLAYLHEESRLKIVHRDIKATNILLDRDLSAKISDFGLAKLDEEENTHISTRVAGTIGYMAPEYAMRGYLTDKADVYSFGVVVLEIVSGTSNTRYMPREEFIFLLDWAYVLLEQGNLLELVDPTLGSSYSEDEVLRLLNIALMCTNPSPTLRPKMSSVVSMIEGQLPVQARILNHSDTSNSIQSN
ncbi:probable LRR receptor-like serine/threonine-protein kinase At1g53430 isoform X4 [Beta vulgaris subsp. vulgaris]|uniref:probable LRR receptor-like serine/threonine-protein kinase At1g53430 isoform X4 n=1 Tax=Beta vulgaris subsp. vulgaris TaxID=3555 RepID=UPI002036FF06|nr:probable LRR receptor-like serine/threonine-protein kinase At1g53430 isoform X4 [Beta vulgaris subsp. vulgaris]